MTHAIHVTDEVEADENIDDYTVYEDANEIYLTVLDQQARQSVAMHYKVNYNVDVSLRGLQIEITW